VLIPAAGASKRLGQPKQLLDYGGKPLLGHIIDVLASITPSEIIVVTGADSQAIRDAVQNPAVHWVHNPHWMTGLGSSIAQGAGVVSPESDGLMIQLCDQYRVTADDLRRLLETWQSNPDHIIAAEADGRCMPPLILPSDIFPELTDLAGQTGARGLLKAYPERVVPVPMEHASHDLDTPAQLKALLESRDL